MILAVGPLMPPTNGTPHPPRSFFTLFYRLQMVYHGEKIDKKKHF